MTTPDPGRAGRARAATSGRTLEPLRLSTAPERIADQLRAAISDGGLGPGTQLNEAQLARRLAVSRGPVREAMQRLIQEGLLRGEPHRGVFVVELDDDDVADIALARGVVERAAAHSLLESRLPEVLAALRRALDELESAIASGDWRAVVAADLRFHEILVDSAESKRLTRMFRTLIAETRMLIGTAIRNADSEWKPFVVAHRSLLDALDRGDKAEVNKLMDLHFATPLIQAGRIHGSEPVA